MKKMIKFIINVLKAAKEQNEIQRQLKLLIPKPKKPKYVKISIPKKYIEMVKMLIMYGIEDCKQLEKIIKNN